MPMRYRTGEEIRSGDRVLFHGEPGTIEFVVTGSTDPETEWYMETYGGGVMIAEPKFFGHAFIALGQVDELEELLQFVARG
jgi:hypothetical protein